MCDFLYIFKRSAFPFFRYCNSLRLGIDFQWEIIAGNAACTNLLGFRNTETLRVDKRKRRLGPEMLDLEYFEKIDYLRGDFFLGGGGEVVGTHKFFFLTTDEPACCAGF